MAKSTRVIVLRHIVHAFVRKLRKVCAKIASSSLAFDPVVFHFVCVVEHAVTVEISGRELLGVASWKRAMYCRVCRATGSAKSAAGVVAVAPCSWWAIINPSDIACIPWFGWPSGYGPCTLTSARGRELSWQEFTILGGGPWSLCRMDLPFGIWCMSAGQLSGSKWLPAGHCCDWAWADSRPAADSASDQWPMHKLSPARSTARTGNTRRCVLGMFE